MRPEREGGGVAAVLTGGGGGVGGRPSLWHTPTPYLFLGFALMMGLIAVALLVLICSRRKPSSSSSPSSRRGAGASSGADVDAACSLVPLDREPKVVVIMAGDRAPSFLASARPLAASVVVPANGGGLAGDVAAV